jgi:hypothetical protein
MKNCDLCRELNPQTPTYQLGHQRFFMGSTFAQENKGNTKFDMLVSMWVYIHSKDVEIFRTQHIFVVMTNEVWL